MHVNTNYLNTDDMATLKRYIATIDIYVYAEDDESALNEAKTICDKINHKDDLSKADVIKLASNDFGSISSKIIELNSIQISK